MTKTESIKKARATAKRHKTEVYVVHDDEYGDRGYFVLTQGDYDDYPDGWLGKGDIVASYDEYGRAA